MGSQTRDRRLGPALALVTVAIACGPGRAPLDGSGSDSDSDSTTTDEASVDDGTTVTVDETGRDSTDTTGAAPQGWCLHTFAQTELYTYYPLGPQDADGDGRDEFWLAQLEFSPAHRTQLVAYELDERGQLALLFDQTVDGHLSALADIDGDGLRDMLLWDEDLPDRWWLAGLPPVGVDVVPQPLSQPDPQGVWLDADDDGRADFFEQRWDTDPEQGIALHLGDGAGGLSEAGFLPYQGLALRYTNVWPGGIPGRFVASFQEEDLMDTDVTAFEVTAQGELLTVADSDPLRISIRHVGNLDGDDVPDLLGFGSSGTQKHLVYLHQGGVPGEYEVESTPRDIRDMLVAPLTAPGQIDQLYWTMDQQLLLRREQGGVWPEEDAVMYEEPWNPITAWNHVMQADGEGPMEIVTLDINADLLLLSRLEPCE